MLGLEAGGLKAVQVIQEQRGDLDPGVDNGRSRVDRDWREEARMIAKFSVCSKSNTKKHQRSSLDLSPSQSF